MKKIVSVVLAALIMLTLIPLSVFAEANTSGILDSGTCGVDGDNITWTLYKNGELVIDGTGEMKNYGYSNDSPWYAYETSISSVEIKGDVTSIGNNAFYACRSITDVTFASSVVRIGKSSFAHCTGLKNISSLQNITYIGRNAFYYCNALQNISVPGNVEFIGENAFYNCRGLTNIVIPASVNTIENGAFELCSATKVIIHDGVTIIPTEAFNYCIKLESITIPESVTAIGDNAFANCTALATVYYKSTQEQWNNMEKGEGNAYFTNADIKLNSTCHSYEAVITAPTCQLEGYTEYTCVICGDKYEDSYIEKVEHSTKNGQCGICNTFIVEIGNEISVSATIYTDSVVTWKTAENNAEITATENSVMQFGNNIRVCASAKIQGIKTGTDTLTAVVDGEIVSSAEIEIIEHIHEYTDSVTAPTCTKQGYTVHTCTCGDSYTDSYVTATGLHDYTAIITEPTCTEKGFTTYLCSCGDSYISDYTEPTGHDCIWITIKDSAIGTQGIEQQQCVFCDEIFDERTIPPLISDNEPGDVNFDGKINASDARLTLRVAAKLEELTDIQFITADVTQDGKITAADARKILRVSAKLETF